MRDDIDLDRVSVHTAPRMEQILTDPPQATAAPTRDTALTALVGAAPILVLAPVPDTETLGCGALLAASFAEQGAQVVCVADGRRSHPRSTDWPGELLAELRRSELRDAVARLGGRPEDLAFLGFEDGAVPEIGPEFDGAVEALCRLCDERGVESLFTASDADPDADHRASAALARAVAARRPGLRLFFYPIWSRWREGSALKPLDGAAFRRFPSGDWAAAKRSAIAAHRSQLGHVVRDDPTGFTLPDAMVERFLTEDEIFFELRLAEAGATGEDDPEPDEGL